MPVEQTQPLITQAPLAEHRRLLRFSLVSALMHVVVLVAQLIWTGGESFTPPPVQIITIDLCDLEFSKQQALPLASPTEQRPDSVKLPLSAPPVPQAASATAKAMPVPGPVAAEVKPAAASEVTHSPSRYSLPSLPSDPSMGRFSLQAETTNAGSQGILFTVPAAVQKGGTTRISAGSMPGVTSSGTGNYLSQCRALIEKHKDYPVTARRGRIAGTVTVSFVLMRDGSLREFGVARTSGSTLLDNAALRAVRSVGRFPPIPLEIYGNELAIDVPITFRLTND